MDNLRQVISKFEYENMKKEFSRHFANLYCYMRRKGGEGILSYWLLVNIYKNIAKFKKLSQIFSFFRFFSDYFPILPIFYYFIY